MSVLDVDSSHAHFLTNIVVNYAGLMELLLRLLASPFPTKEDGGGGPPKGRDNMGKACFTLKTMTTEAANAKYFEVGHLTDFDADEY